MFDFTELRNVLLNDVQFDSMDLDENDNTYLHHVVQHYNEDSEYVIRRLINKHVILDHQNIFGQTVYHLAARHAPPNIFRLLLDSCGDFYSHEREIELDDVYGNTMAHYASVDNIPILVEYGINLERSNFNGLVPLLDAVHQNQIERACMLLECGANPCAVDGNGNSVIHYCVAKYVVRGPIMDAYFSIPRAKYNLKNKDGLSPLDIAIQLKSPDLVKKLWYTWEFTDVDFNPWIETDYLSNTFRNYLRTLKECRRNMHSIA